MEHFNKMPKCCGPLPELKPTENHTVLFNCNVKKEQAPDPYPEIYEDKWDENHVYMPCSPQNIMKIKNENGIEETRCAWSIINEAFSKPIKTLYELKEAISTYYKRSGYIFNVHRLHNIIHQDFTKEQYDEFMKITLPGIIQLALQLPKICTQPIPLLKKGQEHAITLSQKQIGCLLANAFLCTFPIKSKDCPQINFSGLLSSRNILRSHFAEHRPMEKLKCILNYFRRIISKEPVGTLTFHRRYLKSPPNWSSSKKILRNLYITEKGTIEKNGVGMLQVDFADEYIGGLVLQSECAQEEVLFIISPEVIISRLFTEQLEDKETVLIIGHEQYNKYSGYEHTFQWEADFIDETPRDNWGRRYSQMIAMDALCMSGSPNQYRPSIFTRELNKAFCGFNEPEIPPEAIPAIASGKWGCGVFGGDASQKSLIQLMAASQADRDLVLFTFDDYQLKEQVESMYNCLIKINITVGKLWTILEKFYNVAILSQDKNIIPFIFDFIYDELQLSPVVKDEK